MNADRNHRFISKKSSEPSLPSDEENAKATRVTGNISKYGNLFSSPQKDSGTTMASHSRRARLKEISHANAHGYGYGRSQGQGQGGQGQKTTSPSSSSSPPTVTSTGSSEGNGSGGNTGSGKVSVLAKVSMFEAHNKRVASSITPGKGNGNGGPASPIRKFSRSPIRSPLSASSPLASQVKYDVNSNARTNKVNFEPSSFSSKKTSPDDSKSLQSNLSPSSTNSRNVVKNLVTARNIDTSNANASNGGAGLSNLSPAAAASRRVRTFIPENKLSPLGVGAGTSGITHQYDTPDHASRIAARYRSRSQPQSQSESTPNNNAEMTTTTTPTTSSSPYIKTETSSGSISVESSQSERRRKRQLAKQIAAANANTNTNATTSTGTGTRRALSSPASDGRHGHQAMSRTSILRRSPDPDPLDREGMAKSNLNLSSSHHGKKYDLNHIMSSAASPINHPSPSPSTSVPASPTRRRKIKMAGDKLKRDRQRDNNLDITNTITIASVAATTNIAPKISPRNGAVAERNKDWEKLDNKIETNRSSSSPYYKSSEDQNQHRHSISPSLLPEKRDRLRSDNRVDLSPVAFDDDGNVIGDGERDVNGNRGSSGRSTSSRRSRKTKKLVEGFPTQTQLDFELQKMGSSRSPKSSERTKKSKSSRSPSKRSPKKMVSYHFDGSSSKFSDPLDLDFVSPSQRQRQRRQQEQQRQASNSNSSPQVTSSQTQHFFAPIVVEGSPNLTYHDEDDETQFNSVSMQDNHNDRNNKSRDSGIGNYNDRYNHSANSSSNNNSNNTAPSPRSSSRGVDSVSSYYTSSPITMLADDHMSGHGNNTNLGNQSQSQSMNNHASLFQNGYGMDDDAESYTDSITNGSWTGRMRARKKVEESLAEEANFVDQRIDSRLSRTGSKHSVRGKSDDYVSVSSRMLNNVSKQQKLVVTDAKKGMEEMKNFANEDPKSVAIGLGVVSALCGAIIFGPAGIVFGAASIGVGYKVMQMPEEQRSEVKESANSAMRKLQDSAVAANDVIQNSCATACGNPKDDGNDIPTHIGGGPVRPNVDSFGAPESVTVIEDSFSPRQDPIQRGMGLKVSNLNPSNPQDLVPRVPRVVTEQKTPVRKMRRITPACRRMGRITPVGQIHSLDPALHPRAWLDVMASAWTSREEKNEAMEEILLLAKDKNHAQMLLEEGILDSLMYIIRGFFSHYADVQRKTGQTAVPVETYMADLNFIHAKLASTCCVALGKAHCAVVHTNGEEMIAATVHVTVPVAKQIAQMLYEIPHHMAVITNPEGEGKEVFKLTTEMSTHQAEALASSIFSLSMGKVELTLEEI